MQSPFHALGASESVVAALARRGITEPFPIQTAVLGDALAGRDVVAQSPTGSGKTLAFAIPLVERADRQDPQSRGARARPDPRARRPGGQRDPGHRRRARHARGRRGRRRGHRGQGKAAARSDVVVATPGRLEDLVARRLVRLDDVSMLVLDEVDRMLDVGFKPAVERIVALLPRRAPDAASSPPRSTAPVGELAAKYTRNPVRASAPAPRDRGGARRAPLPDRREGRQARRARRRAAKASAAWPWSSCARSTAPAGWPSAWSAAACAPSPCTAT